MDFKCTVMIDFSTHYVETDRWEFDWIEISNDGKVEFELSEHVPNFNLTIAELEFLLSKAKEALKD